MSAVPATPSTARKAASSSLRTPRTTSSALPPIPGPSPAYVGGSRSRHAVYGIDDRIVLDLGSRVWKAGFSGESKPRVVATVQELCGGGEDALRQLHGEEALVEVSDEERDRRETVLRERIVDGLRTVFFKHLMVDPKQRKVIVLEDALVPHAFKAAVATALFDNLGVPSASFCSAPLLTLMASGTLTGLVVDVGHLETCITPVFASRPLFPFVRSTPRAGARLTATLHALLLRYGRFLPIPSVLTGPPIAASAPPRPLPVPPELLTPQVVEDVKTRLCFVPPVTVAPASTPVIASDDGDDDHASKLLHSLFSTSSSAIPCLVPLSTPSTSSSNPAPLGTLPKGVLHIPGWIRSHFSAPLFTAASSPPDDESDTIPSAILSTIERLPMDLRRSMAESLVVAGGGAMVPGFIPRLREELQQSLEDDGGGSGKSKRRRPRFSTIRGLRPHIAILNDPNPPSDASARSGAAPAFAPSLLAWLGGSLAGSVKTGGEEVVREKWNAVVEQEVADGLAAAASSSSTSEAGAGEERGTAPVAAEGADEERVREWLKQKRGIRKACALVPDWTRLAVPVS